MISPCLRDRRVAARRRGLGAPLLALVIACIPDHGAAFPRAMRDADDASAHGDLREAARRFDRAASLARLPRDRDEARHAAARVLARAGALRDALSRLDELAKESPPGPEAGAAAYDAASLRVSSGDEDAGWRDTEAMLRRFPDDGDARPALHAWLRHLDDTAGASATLAWLRSVQPELDVTDRAEEIAYEIAVRLSRTQDLTGARDAFLAVAARWPYPGGALWDDALYHASAIDEASGHPRAAAEDLRRMLDRRERALVVGSAERARYADAQLHLGELYRDRLADHTLARAAFHALFTDFPDSSIRDRGLFEEAELLRSDGDVASACATLETLVRDVPDSRYAPCAVGTCPTMHATPGPGAPATCHAYIDRPRERGLRDPERSR
jgi:tetratricopeptide (TPR) repeat protein